jgi:mono/diheme cytochrome c family protein
MKSDLEQHDAQQRENPDPHEQAKPVPKTVLVTVTLVLAFCIGYIFTTQRNDDPAMGDHRTMSTLVAKTADAGGGAVDGAQVYSAQCVACHQATGAGLPGVFPPLAGSEWVTGKDTLIANIVLHGITGKLTVKGAAYSGQMPAFKDKLSDAEIAAVLSHVRSNFGNGAAKVTPETVKTVRDEGKDRKAPWTGDDELDKLK